MAEPTQILFSHKEVVEALVKKHGIHDGIWGIYVRFALKAANIGVSDSDLLPAAIIPVVELGLQKFEKENNISVDAAKVNPAQAPTISAPKPRRKRIAH